ncbi:MAG: DNA polymerase III subunit beta [Clostridiales bacterium]|nr:DNA polymerase III subunit beta [Clostridiales bacterium]
MKFNCNKSDLLDSIVIVQKAIKTNSTVQILDGILIQAEDGHVKLTGYDLETGIEADLESDIIEEGSVVVNSKYFGEIVKMLPDEMTTVESDDRFNVSISSGEANTVLKGNSADSYPKIPVIETDSKITVSQKLLKDMINSTIFAVSKDGTRQYLTGCNLESDGSTLTMVAIDGFRMALRRADVGTDFPVMNFIIPGKALTEAAKIFDGNNENSEVIIYNSANHLLFDIGSVRIISRLIGGPFVNYNAIIQKNPKTIVTIDRKNLLDAVNRAALIITSDERRCPVQVKMKNASTLLISATADAGTHKETIKIDTQGEMVDIDFNSRYMIDALKAIEDDEIRIEFNGGQGPCIIVPTQGDSYVYLILPIRR